MKTKKLKLDDLISEESLNIISQAEIIAIMGGTYPNPPASWDCVLNCFDYLDGSAHDFNFYRYNINYNLGYEPSGYGGVYTSHIPTIGGFGGMSVNLVQGSSYTVNASGLVNGSKAIMVFNAGVAGADHAVIVEGTVYENGVLNIRYYDPTTNTHSRVPATSVSGMYTVGAVGSYTGS